MPFLAIPFIAAVITIGLVTFYLCFLGFLFGKQLGKHIGKRVEIFGGIVLITIGIKILVESFL